MSVSSAGLYTRWWQYISQLWTISMNLSNICRLPNNPVAALDQPVYTAVIFLPCSAYSWRTLTSRSRAHTFQSVRIRFSNFSVCGTDIHHWWMIDDDQPYCNLLKCEALVTSLFRVKRQTKRFYSTNYFESECYKAFGKYFRIVMIFYKSECLR